MFLLTVTMLEKNNLTKLVKNVINEDYLITYIDMVLEVILHFLYTLGTY